MGVSFVRLEVDGGEHAVGDDNLSILLLDLELHAERIADKARPRASPGSLLRIDRDIFALEAFQRVKKDEGELCPPA